MCFCLDVSVRCPSLTLFLARLCDVSSANLVASMPAEISHADRLRIIDDFERGRAHVLMQMALKVSHWEAFPWFAYGAACQDVPKSKEILQETLDSDCGHPQVAKTREAHLRSELEEVLANPQKLFDCADPRFLKHAREWLAIARMISIVERRVEGKHAASAKEVKRAPHHGCPYVSLLHRVGEIKSAFKEDPACITDFAEKVYRTRSAFTAVKLLNLDCHPEAKAAQSSRDPVFTRIVYHADPYVKYGMAHPELPVDKPPHGDQVLPVAMDSSQALRHELAGRHVQAKLQGMTEQNVFFSTPVSSNTVKTLTALLVPRRRSRVAAEPEPALTCASLAEGAADDVHGSEFWMPKEAAPGLPVAVECLFFWKVQDKRNAAPAKREKVEGEHSLSGCLGVTTHAVLKVNEQKREICLSMTPTNLASVVSDQTPLVLNPLHMPLRALEATRAWLVSQDKMVFTFATHYLHSLPSTVQEEVPSLVNKLMRRPAGIHFGKPSPTVQNLLDCLRRDGMISEVDSGGGVLLGKLTEKGTHLVQPCVAVKGGEKLCRRAHEVHPLDMTTYEVILELEAVGFQHTVLSKQDASKKKKQTYEEGGVKEWVSKETEVRVSHLYLVALLTTKEHGKPVPHLQKESVYKQILGLSSQEDKPPPKKRVGSRQLKIIGEHFCPELLVPDEETHAKKRRMGVGQGKRRRSRDAGSLPGVSEDEVQVEVEASDLDLGEGMGNSLDLSISSPSLSSSSSSSTDSSDSSSSSSSGSEDDAQAQGNATGPPETENSPAASSSKPSDPVTVAAPKPDSMVAKSGEVPSDVRIRGKFQAEPWGVFKLIYFDRQGATGFQLTCTNPSHNPEGQALCTKSRSDKFDGGADVCLRQLKHWALLGKDVASKAEHNGLWKGVVASASNGTLPSHEDLEAMKVTSWAASSASSGGSQPSKRKRGA